MFCVHVRVLTHGGICAYGVHESERSAGGLAFGSGEQAGPRHPGNAPTRPRPAESGMTRLYRSHAMQLTDLGSLQSQNTVVGMHGDGHIAPKLILLVLAATHTHIHTHTLEESAHANTSSEN